MAFAIKSPPEFTLGITQWNQETDADGSEMAKDLEKLLNNDVYLKEEIEQIRDIKTASLTAAGWSAAAPFTQTVAVEGITAADTPIVALSIPKGLSGDTVKSQKKAYGMVDRAESGAGQITFYCYNKKPAVDFQAAIKGV